MEESSAKFLAAWIYVHVVRDKNTSSSGSKIILIKITKGVIWTIDKPALKCMWMKLIILIQ